LRSMGAGFGGAFGTRRFYKTLCNRRVSPLI
jgi:hypothetical protein